jgi:hypothetical protein
MTQLSRMGLAALTLAQECGFRVLPLAVRGKVPLIKGGHAYLDATTHPEQIAAWWDATPDANIGVYPGGSQHFILDVDSAAGETIARALGAFDTPTLETITSRGVHRWFRLPEGMRFTNHSPWTPHIDVRAHAGYVLAPPSVHPEGHVYRWRGDFDTIADVPPAVLKALLLPERTTPPPPANPSGPMRAPDEIAERRILKFVAKIGELSDGRQGAAFRFAAFLAHDIQLDDAASWRMLVAWNSHNTPPLCEAVLSKKHANGRRYGGRRGSSAA